jgi:RNA-directed DNA polymerase
MLSQIGEFLKEKLKIELHPKKVDIRPLHQGIDFLGYVTLPHHRVLRATTRRRMFRKLSERLRQFFNGEIASDSLNQTMQSYFGMMTHADTFELKSKIKNQFCWQE